jgi:hypothetical protein
LARDRVPVAQEKVLAFRSGNTCAYPDCGAKLVFAAIHDDDLDKAVGKAAHIAAASESGPRFDPDMTTEQRGSAANLIFVCGPHHDAIDYQLHYHTREFLLEAKEKHERKVARAIRYSMGEVRFEHLEIVCSVLSIQAAPVNNDDVELPLEIHEKIDLNAIGGDGRDLILLGLAQADEVRRFITSISAFRADFGNMLAARFKQFYYQGVTDGLKGDELYIFVYSMALDHAGPVESPELHASVLSVVAYLFSLCEIFEHEPAAA